MILAAQNFDMPKNITDNLAIIIFANGENMRRIIAAPDSFKGSLSSAAAAQSIASGVHQVLPDMQVIKVPLSDGGEGLASTLVEACQGRLESITVTGPLGFPVEAGLGIIDGGYTAVAEMASASGLILIPDELRSPMKTTTFGTGELIAAALDMGCRRIILGVGGSATNDGGVGMAEALGVRFLDHRRNLLARGASGLLDLDLIDASGLDKRIRETELIVASDVTNPLCGLEGASYIYGPQKGAVPEMLPVLDEALSKLARITARDLRIDLDFTGAGAGGGLAGGAVAFLGGIIRPGTNVVFETLGFEQILADGADLVITGEGEINGQSIYGKVPVAVARLAKKYNIPVLALVGSIGPGAKLVYKEGIDAVMSIMSRPMSLKDAMEGASGLLEGAAERAMRLINIPSHI